MIRDNDKIFENLFEYDFNACVYNILNNVGYDLSNVNFKDKTIRNIQIGKLQKENPSLKYILSSGMKNLIKLYIQENNLKDHEIIWRQKDGFIITRKLDKNNVTMNLSFKNNISKLIKSMDNTKILILYSDNTFAIKGMSNKPLDTSFYTLLFNIDFSNRKKVMESCEIVRQKFLNSTNIQWFTRESKDGTLTVPMVGNYLLTLNKSSLYSVDIKEVDKKIIFDNYIYPFFQTLMITYNERKRKNYNGS